MKNDSNPWRSRGYLPHYDDKRTMQVVTYHLADSLPVKVLKQTEEIVKQFPDSQRGHEGRKLLETYLDAGHGACLLRDPARAKIVLENWQHFDGLRYNLIAWVVMPNHVHLLVESLDGWEMKDIVHSWKSYTAHQILGDLPPSERPSILWRKEYWDRFIRNERHFFQAITYIENNPVKAGLCSKTEDWLFSSATMARQKTNAGEPPAVPGDSQEDDKNSPKLSDSQ